ncbi:hypothetical protein H6762_05095 [Candidatus Nomurabacteria bacterium]|nr:hypothetical protein [Candidatus Nomurabacteria bacterium]
MDSIFDLLIACEVLEQILNDEKYLRAIANRIAPRGKLLFTVPATKSISHFLMILSVTSEDTNKMTWRDLIRYFTPSRQR